MKNNTNSAEAQTESEPNVQAQPPTVAVETLPKSEKNSVATDGCAAAPGSDGSEESSFKQTLSMSGDDQIILSCYADFLQGFGRRKQHIVVPISSIKELFANPESVIDVKCSTVASL